MYRFAIVAHAILLLGFGHLASAATCPEMQRIDVSMTTLSLAMKHEHGHTHMPWLGIYQDNEMLFSTHHFSNPASDGLPARIEMGEIGQYTPALVDLIGDERADALREGKVYVWVAMRADLCPPCERIAKDVEELFERFRCEEGSRVLNLDVDVSS